MNLERIIIHVDMDAFYASVEQLDHPEWAGKPVIVGADPKGGKGRGVVCACSYEARRFGVHSALPISRAWRLCSTGIFVRPRMSRYQDVSDEIFRNFREFTDLVEPLSIDEAFLDITGSIRLFGGGPAIARRIKERIGERTGLVASVGVAQNKYLAKVASDLEKPDGLVVVEPGSALSFLAPLPIRRLWGVGEKTAEKLTGKGLRTIGDIARLSEQYLCSLLGDHGASLYRLARGEDDRPVIPHSPPKSIGNEETFSEDTDDRELIHSTLLYLCDKVAGRLRAKKLKASGLTLKLRDEFFSTLTRSMLLDQPSDVTRDIYEHAMELLDRTRWHGERKVRLVGITAHRLWEDETGSEQQLGLFRGDFDSEKLRRTETAVDAIRERFGSSAVRRGGVER